MSKPEDGIVVRKSSRNIEVDSAVGSLRCSLRGKFRQHSTGRSPVVVGDRVLVTSIGNGEGVLEKILPRSTELTRGKGDGETLVVAANVDQLLIVLAARDPPPRWALVDRMIAYAHRDDLDPGICVNKWDQVSSRSPTDEDGSDSPKGDEHGSQEHGDGGGEAAERLEETIALYRELGYPVFCTSALDEQGLADLVVWLQAKSTVFSGHSGVGKSTLLNALNPDLDLRTGHINKVTGKGRHTTTAASLLSMPFGGYLVDTPGFRSFSLVGMRPSELGAYFPEFRERLNSCKYPDCTHTCEPRCGVRSAVEQGEISKFRYDNYLRILEGLDEKRRSE